MSFKTHKGALHKFLYNPWENAIIHYETPRSSERPVSEYLPKKNSELMSASQKTEKSKDGNR